MTTLNMQTSMLSYEDCKIAMGKWADCRSSFFDIQKKLPTNYIFNLSREQLDWMRNVGGKSQVFCAGVGLFEDKVTLILYPLDDSGKRIESKEYPCTSLSELTMDIKLQEIQEYTVVKNAVLSKGLLPVERNSDMAFPISDKPILEQDTALDAIEKWRLEGMDWFYRECNIDKGAGIFRKFYVSTEDLCLSDDSLEGITCSFGLKYNDIYEKLLVTLIFISFRENLQNSGRAETISNTYDWAKPCPPICRLPDDGVGCEF
ncbi:hypothetical protein [Chryseobacterium sp. Mn2064]|uniref:hypothetical protein n=1 Tax=Chryseobacterium sp. Mn2064 TaxID=3395263 RepID=UPI003BBE73E5